MQKKHRQLINSSFILIQIKQNAADKQKNYMYKLETEEGGRRERHKPFIWQKTQRSIHCLHMKYVTSYEKTYSGVQKCSGSPWQHGDSMLSPSQGHCYCYRRDAPLKQRARQLGSVLWFWPIMAPCCPLHATGWSKKCTATTTPNSLLLETGLTCGDPKELLRELGQLNKKLSSYVA